MQAKQKFFYMVTGAVLGVTILLIGMAVSPTTAQRDKFGEITCTGLTVLNPNGTSAVIVGVDDDGGLVGVYGKGRESYAAMHIQEHGGIVGLYNEYGESYAAMHVDEHGGRVNVHSNDGKSGAAMHIRGRGGRVIAYGKDGKSSASLVIMGHSGAVGVIDRYGTPTILD